MSDNQTVPMAILAIVGSVVAVLIVYGMMGSPRLSFDRVPASSPPPESSVSDDYARDAKRQAELGSEQYPTQDEIREYLILDARQAVREGSMSESDYESWTGQKFPR